MTLLLAVGTPLLAFFGAALGALLNRRAARELENRSRREETMRNLRWAADHAVDADRWRGALGMAELEELGNSGMAEDEQRRFVNAALSIAVTRHVETTMDDGPSGGVRHGQ
jgi:hypothetical protein